MSDVFQSKLRPILGEAPRRNPNRGQSAALKSDVLSILQRNSHFERTRERARRIEMTRSMINQMF
jgi:hypothetical protein